MGHKILYIIAITLVCGLTAQAQTYRYSYRFTDASVPPKYHRSYEIIVENGNVQFTVDSYGDVLYTETNPIDEKQVSDFVTKLKASNLHNKTEKKDDGCTGGTGVSFSFQSTQIKPVDGFEYYCANEIYGNLSGKVDDAVRAFKSLITDFSNKLYSTND